MNFQKNGKLQKMLFSGREVNWFMNENLKLKKISCHSPCHDTPLSSNHDSALTFVLDMSPFANQQKSVFFLNRKRQGLSEKICDLAHFFILLCHKDSCLDCWTIRHTVHKKMCSEKCHCKYIKIYLFRLHSVLAKKVCIVLINRKYW
jgi:hypothetical protein